MLLVNQLDRVQMRVFLRLRIEELICDADFFERDIGVPTSVERFASHHLLHCVPSEFCSLNLSRDSRPIAISSTRYSLAYWTFAQRHIFRTRMC